MTDQERIEEIRKRVEAATPGPWLTDGPFVYKLNDQGVNHFYAGIQGGNRDSATEAERTAIARFIAHARTDIPALLGEIERLRDRLNKAAIDCSQANIDRDLASVAVSAHKIEIHDLRTELAAKDAEIERWRVDYASIVDQGAEIEKRQAELLTEARAEAESLRNWEHTAREMKKAIDAEGAARERAEAALREIHDLSQRTGMTFEAQSFETDRIIDAYFTQQKDTDQ